ncbi:hypothetical protein PVL29_004683 [Vitis rotundifolia]|uniref:Uncharacterized protein n=1 Tax=Vitis rotundifolia TaxID=103349 RepID=A0AA39A8N5_VITRO|nr:hypothetical protein PVL29_004683 [Vitis rotundifolia]
MSDQHPRSSPMKEEGSTKVLIWNYDEATLLNNFDNHNFPDKGISKLCIMNELDDSLPYLYAAGKISSIMAWDLDKEHLVYSIPSSSDSNMVEGVVGIGFQPGLDPFLDMRNGNHAYLTIDAHRGSLTVLAVHLEGSPLCNIRFNPTSMAQKIGHIFYGGSST